MTNAHLYIRKFIHVVWGLAVLGIVTFLPRSLAMRVLCIWAIGMTLAEILRLIWKPWQQIFQRWFGPLLKDWEQYHVPTGATTLIYTALIVVWGFEPRIAVPSIALLTLGDALAALVGKTLPIIRFPNGKSISGAIAFFLVAIGVYSHYFNTLGGRLVIVAVLVTLVELLSPSVIENAGIGLASAFLLQIFS